LSGEHLDVVAIGASAGGVTALMQVVAGLAENLPASVLVVLHVPRDSPSALAAILDRSGPLPVAPAVDGEELLHGRIYVAPADRHLLVIDGRLRLSCGPAENGHRPAIDPTFRSVARSHAGRVIGVVLSGSRDDGAAGLATIAARGGRTIVQDPADAVHASMPRAALTHVAVDHVVPAAQIGALVSELVATAQPRQPVGTSPAAEDTLDAEIEVAELKHVPVQRWAASAAGFGCPSCGGGLFELAGQTMTRYRCRVGHAWSAESLLGARSEELHSALWIALRAVEEKAALATRMADGAAGRRSGALAARYRATAADDQHAADLLRELIGRMSDLDASRDA